MQYCLIKNEREIKYIKYIHIYYVIFNTKNNHLELSVLIQLEACDVSYKKKQIVKKYTIPYRNNKNYLKKNESVIFTRLLLWKRQVQKDEEKLPQNGIIHIE